MLQTTPPRPQLSVAIIARNEARHIGEALASVATLADEIVVLLDNRTRDTTASIATAHGARVLIEPWRGFPAQRNYALQVCTGEWVLFLDADERIPPPLANELRALLRDQPAAAGFWIPRENSFFGQVLRGGGWYPDPQLRLMRRSQARYDEQRLVHELVQIDGPVSTLRNPLLHLNIEQFDELWRKQTSYAYQEAQTLWREGRRARLRNFVGAPLREFVRRYLQLGGWRDGRIGLLMCATLAYFEVIKFMHLWGLQQVAR
ncbi:MAG: glycosyltransferase family 2 protein [Roseiflexaceae bacterium]